MLDHRLAAGPPPDEADLEALCSLLVDFYLRQPKGAEAADVFLERLAKDSRKAATHLVELAKPSGTVARPDVLAFAEPQIEAMQDEIRARGAVGLIVEGHGDLRAEHVCLTSPIVVFDRMEIDHGARLVDPFFEVNGLGIECALLGAGWVRAVLLQHLSCALPPPSPGLLRLYGVISCLTRARLAADHFRDRPVMNPTKWRNRTARYLQAATRLIDSNSPT
jgi:aminoglycoside phosphotransferase family enzyme